MPKGIDPKAYAARVTKAKKVVESMDPATRAKIKDMYPKVTKEAIAKKATEKAKQMPKVKITGTATSKPRVSNSMTKAAPATASKPKAPAMSKTTTKAPAKTTPKPKVTKKPEKMTPQDAAMKKILEKKYGKIYG